MKSKRVFNSFPFTLLIVIGMLFSLGSAYGAKTLKEELDAAKKAKKTVFLVVTAAGINGANSMKIAQQANKQLKESVVLSLDRDDKSNSEIVSKLGLSSAPLPLIMVVGMNGLPAGGLPEKDATAEKLVGMAPSPKKAEALSYLNDKKPVFVIGYKKSFSDRSAVVEKVKAAIAELKGNAAFVEVDMDDTREKALLEQIGADIKAKNTVTVVVNAQGKVTGNYTGVTDAKQLTTAALTAPKSGCAPGACGGKKSCGK